MTVSNGGIEGGQPPQDPNPSAGGTGKSLIGVLEKPLAIAAGQAGPLQATMIVLAGIGAVTTAAIAIATGTPYLAFATLAFIAVLAIIAYRADLSRGKPPAPPSTPSGHPNTAAIRQALTMAADEVAAQLGIQPKEDVRANVFAPCADGKLRMVPGCVVRTGDTEQTITMPLRYGATGRALHDGRLRISVGRPTGQPGAPPSFGEVDLDPSEASKAHERLSWIISVPIPATAEQKRWVFNVDGLQHRSEDALKSAVVPLLKYASLLEKQLAEPSPST